MKKKAIDKYFFFLYNFYFKDGKYRNGLFSKFLPWHYTVNVLSLGTMLWVIFLQSVYRYLFLNNTTTTTSDKLIYILVYFLSFMFYWGYFITDRRYIAIYSQFKEQRSIYKSFITLFAVVILPLFLILFCSLTWHRII
jgi:hypothetical protein